MARKKSKQDVADEKRRAKTLKQAILDYAAFQERSLADNYQRLIDIPEAEWKAAEEADAAEVTNGS